MPILVIIDTGVSSKDSIVMETMCICDTMFRSSFGERNAKQDIVRTIYQVRRR